ncbi:putative cytochrome p450 [Lyophyllum shimeji]|uniref:Cytochrome p450 n=1 Tax=Lyophyllum shimeji TaxID=47721 RepID=A0A9P3PVV3_LYOSH|nr:putative cytochrome p450 [Lyophyllum shimeji]
MQSVVDILTQPRTIAALVLCATVLGVVYRRFTRHSLPLPPGPPCDSWIFGHNLPKSFAYRTFEEWAKTYGPVFALRQGVTTVIVINRQQPAIEIMEHEGSALVDRPVSISAGETLSGGMRTLLTPAGERFKKMRKALHAHLAPKIVQSYIPILTHSAKEHILDLIDKPDLHLDHAKRYAASVVMALAYGKTSVKHDDPDLAAINRCLHRLGLAVRPGAWKVDVFPFLRYVPGYLDELKEGHKEELNLFRRSLAHVKGQMERNEPASDSFAKYLLERQSELGLSDDEIAYLAGSLFGAGTDTSASAISIAVLAATRYPAAAKRVQNELDRVVGRSRPPTHRDVCEELNELRAFVLETFRWRPVSAGGFAHKATRDILWNGYVIPKGATVIGNHWAIGRDPALFPDPETFDPQRWLRTDGTIREDLKSFQFGFGRRVCPGQHLALASVLLNTALILWTFTLREDPKHPIDELAFNESANTHPLPFKVIFEPRAVPTREAIKEMMEDYEHL